MSVTEPQPDVPTPKLRWYQYSLRTLFVFVTLCALPCSWVAVKKEQGRQQAEAAAEIEKLGGGVSWSSSGPDWLQKLLGETFFKHVTKVQLGYIIGNDPFVYLFLGRPSEPGIPDWENVDSEETADTAPERPDNLDQVLTAISLDTQAFNTNLKHLKKMTDLQELVLTNRRLTDAGLEHVKGLSQLRRLRLDGTQVTDAGLEYLKGLSRLQWLHLDNTQVTDGGVQKLQQSLPNCKIVR